MSKRRRDWVVGAYVVGCLALGLSVWAGAFIVISRLNTAPALIISFGNTGLTLAFGGVLGGLVKKLFDLWDRHRADHEAQQAFYRALLDDLKAVYNEVDRARLLSRRINPPPPIATRCSRCPTPTIACTTSCAR